MGWEEDGEREKEMEEKKTDGERWRTGSEG